MHQHRRAARVVPLLVLVLALGGCGGARPALGLVDSAAVAAADAATGAYNAVRRLFGVADDGPIPRPPPAAEQVAARREAERLEQYWTDELSSERHKQVVDAACDITDLVALAEVGSIEEAATEVFISHGGDATIRFRATGLARDIAAVDSPESSAAAAPGLVLAVVCEFS